MDNGAYFKPHHSAIDLWAAVETLESAARYLLDAQLSSESPAYMNSDHDAYRIVQHTAHKVRITANKAAATQWPVRQHSQPIEQQQPDFGKPSDVGFGGAE